MLDQPAPSQPLAEVKSERKAEKVVLTDQTAKAENQNDKAKWDSPKWFKYLPKFLSDSSLFSAFFRTKSGRYIAGVRTEIAAVHSDLFSNVNRAYSNAAPTLHIGAKAKTAGF
jgi:hypothetical protein